MTYKREQSQAGLISAERTGIAPTGEMTIFEPQNVATIAQAAPQAYRENSISHERCLQFGEQLLHRVTTEGMSDELDQEIASFIERAKKTLKKMNGKRSAVTQLFDSIRSAYTKLENEVDPSRKGTVAAQLQEHRNRYAAKKREEYEAEMRRKQMEQAKANAKSKYAADVEEDLTRQFKALLATVCNTLTSLDKSLTLENYDNVYSDVKNTSEQISQEWLDTLRPEVLMPSLLSPEEARAVAADVRQRMEKSLREDYEFEVTGTRDTILDRLPSKRKELERAAKASQEEAERIRLQIAERERKEAEQREKERAEREAKEKAAAEIAAQKQEMNSLFGSAELQAAQYQPKASVKKRISVISPEGFMKVVGLWWAQCGCTLSVAELEKIFSKQLTFCNKLANDKENPIYIQSEHIEYVDEVKAH